MHEALGGQITLSAVIVFLIQLAKNTSWIPKVDINSDKLNRWLAVILSGVAAVGIHWAYDANFSWVSGGVLTIIWPGFNGVVHGAWEWLQSFAVQEWMYRSTVKSTTSK
jgi:hypothetical protein